MPPRPHTGFQNYCDKLDTTFLIFHILDKDCVPVRADHQHTDADTHTHGRGVPLQSCWPYLEIDQWVSIGYRSRPRCDGYGRFTYAGRHTSLRDYHLMNSVDDGKWRHATVLARALCVCVCGNVMG